MVSNVAEAKDLSKLITPNIKKLYSDFKVTFQSSYFLTFEAKSLTTEKTHTIRALDTSSPFVKENYHTAATLFVQELLYLASTYPNTILIKTFEIDNEKICFASTNYSSPYLSQQQAPLNAEKECNKEKMPIVASKLLSDLSSNINFLLHSMNVSRCSELVTPKNIFQFKDESDYFLGDWSKARDNLNLSAQTEKEKQNDCKSDGSKEVLELAWSVLTVVGVSSEAIEKVKRIDTQSDYMTAIDEILGKLELSTHYKDLLRKMLDKDPKKRPKIEELSTKSKEILPSEESQEPVVLKDVSKSVNVNQPLVEESKIGEVSAPITKNPSSSILSSLFNKSIDKLAPHNLLACSSEGSNKITIFDIEKKEEYCNFDGAKLESKVS